jgi:curved DNA-binding protein
MKDYYKILGLSKSASPEEIKKAYRKAAMQHHPDRGGDEKIFKDIEEAYRVLTDPEKKSMIDQGIDPNQGSQYRQQSGNFNNMEDIFNAFGFNFGFGPRGFHTQQQPAKNKSLNINMTLTLEEAYTGVNKSLSIAYPSGKEKVVNVNIPPGIDNGMAIRYSGMGDDTLSHLPPGDLNVVIRINNHHKFAREGFNLLTDVNIDCFDAILGTTVRLNTLDDRILEVSIPAGTQPNTTLRIKNEGMKDSKGTTGVLYVRVGISIPAITDTVKQQLVRQLKN